MLVRKWASTLHRLIELILTIHWLNNNLKSVDAVTLVTEKQFITVSKKERKTHTHTHTHIHTHKRKMWMKMRKRINEWKAAWVMQYYWSQMCHTDLLEAKKQATGNDDKGASQVENTRLSSHHDPPIAMEFVLAWENLPSSDFFCHCVGRYLLGLRKLGRRLCRNCRVGIRLSLIHISEPTRPP